MGTTENLTPAEAQAALQQAEGTAVTPRSTLRVLQVIPLGIALAMAAVLVIIKAADGHTAGLVMGMTVYGVAIAVLMSMMSRVRSMPRGFSGLYVLGVVGASVAYGLGVAVVATGDRPWWLVALLAALTIAPAAYAVAAMRKLPVR